MAIPKVKMLAGAADAERETSRAGALLTSFAGLGVTGGNGEELLEVDPSCGGVGLLDAPGVPMPAEG